MPAFNPFMPQGYQFPAMPYQMPQQPQNTGFVHVQSETQAREWSVSPGGSVTFINDNEPYCYTKALGLSQFDSPVFKKFRLVEEHDSPQIAPEPDIQPQSIDLSEYMTKAEFEPFKALLDRIEKEFFNESAE